jgi:hypothetical protein
MRVTSPHGGVAESRYDDDDLAWMGCNHRSAARVRKKVVEEALFVEEIRSFRGEEALKRFVTETSDLVAGDDS